MEGGEVIVDQFGMPTGIFNEHAISMIYKHIPEETPETNIQAFNLAMEACHKNGITSFHDAGISSNTIALYDDMKLAGKMNIRMYAMLRGG